MAGGPFLRLSVGAAAFGLLGFAQLTVITGGQSHHGDPSDPWTQDDDAGDGTAGAATPPFVDIRSVQIADEDPIGLWLGVATQPFARPLVPKVDAIPGNSSDVQSDNLRFQIDFGTSRTEPTYTVVLYAFGYVGPNPDGVGFHVERLQAALQTNFPGVACPDILLQAERPECQPETVTARFDEDQDLFEVWLPKRTLAGLGPQTQIASDSPARPPADLELGPGAFVTGLSVSSTEALPTLFDAPARPVGDRAPNIDAYPDYEFQAPMANARVEITLAEDVASLQVVAGRVQAYRMAATNHLPEIRHLELQYWASIDGVLEPTVPVRGINSLFLPPEQTRYFPVILELPASLQAGHTFTLEIYGATRESALDHGHFRAPVSVSHYLGPEHKLLHVHAVYDPSESHVASVGDPQGAEPIQHATCDGDTTQDCYRDFLSPNPTEEGATPNAAIAGAFETWEPGTGVPCFDRTCAGWIIPTIRPVPLGVRLDGSVPPLMQATFTTASEIGNANVQFLLVAGDGSYTFGEEFTTVFEGSTEAVFGAGPVTVSIEGKPQDLQLQGGSQLQAYLNVRWSVPTSRASIDQVFLDARGSWIELPLIPTEADVARAAESPFMFFVDGDPVRGVNAGETTLFRVGLMNLGSATDRIELAAQSGNPGFRLTLLPGKQFEIVPGDGVTLGVEVSADRALKQGESTEITLRATDSSGAVSIATLKVEVVKEDVADEEGAFVADPDDKAKMVSDGRLPAFEVWSLVPVVAAVAFLRRRA